MVTLAAGGLVFAGHAVAGVRAITIQTGELAGPPLMGLGVQWDPYDSFRPTAADWNADLPAPGLHAAGIHSRGGAGV